MKKIGIILCAAVLLFTLASCGEKKDGDRVDLTALSSTVVYSEVYNMLTNPDDYTGKTVKMTGTMSTYEDKKTGNIYRSCIIADATACCSQGLEFVLTDGNYPKDGQQITVEGTFGTYFEGTNRYCQLTGAKIVGAT